MNEQIFKIARTIFKQNPFSRLAFIRLFISNPTICHQISSFNEDDSNIVHYNNKENLIEIIVQPFPSGDPNSIKGAILFMDQEDRPTIGIYYDFDLSKIGQKKNTHRFGIIDARKEGRNNADEILQWGNNNVISQVCYNFRCDSFDTNFNVYLGQSIVPMVNIHDINYPVTIQIGTGGGVFNGTTKSKILNYQQWARVNKFFTRKVKSMELLYRATTHGFESTTFHAKVDGTGPSLIIIKNNFNKTFGGYHHAGWITNGAYAVADSNNFIFSVDENLKFPYTSTANNSVYSNTGYGPTFGGNHDIHVNANPRNTNGSYVRMASNSYYDTRLISNEKMCGSTTDNWRTEEIEAFKINY